MDKKQVTANGKMEKRILAIGILAGGLKQEVQSLAIDILIHTYKFGDYSFATKMINALGDGVRRDSLIKWFEIFGGLGWDKAEKKFTSWKGKEFIAENKQKAQAKSWTECKAEVLYSGFNMSEEVEKLLTRYSNAMKLAAKDPSKADKIKGDVNESLMQRFAAMVNFKVIIEEPAVKA